MSPEPKTPKPRAYIAVVDAANAGARLDVFIARRFGQELDLSKRQAKARIEEGSVAVGGHSATRVERELREGEKVELILPVSRESAGWSVTPGAVIFEDEDLIAIDKPAGLPTQATLDVIRHNLHRAVEEYLRARGGEGYAGLHQRLDKDTSGVIVFTKSKRANKGLAAQVSGHTISKTYAAIAAAPKETRADEWTIRNHLKKISGKPARMKAAQSGGDWSETKFCVLEKHAKGWLIEARPLTGRMHQIRVHLADSGSPILGDPLYAAPRLARRASRCMLHAWRLTFVHPISGATLCLEAPLPGDFTELLERIRS